MPNLVYNPKTFFKEFKMKVLVYPSHHDLPFWSSGEQKDNNVIQVVDPENLDQWMIQDPKYQHLQPFSHYEDYPIFKALSELDCFVNMVAHISFPFDGKSNMCGMNIKRKWIHFSTMPEFIDGVPQVFDAGKPLVENLWVADNGTSSPYQFLHPSAQIFDPKVHTAYFWKRWFIETLMNYCNDQVSRANQQIQKAEHTIALFSKFPKKEDICL